MKIFENVTASHSQNNFNFCRYGDYTCFLDATYKTCKYAFSLFLLCVGTNGSQCVAAIFITDKETTSAIYEALSLIKQHNPSWNPSSFMMDGSEAQRNAVKQLFPGDLMYSKISVI